MANPAKNLKGKKFNTLTVLERVGSLTRPNGTKSHSTWSCLCDCGNTTVLPSNEIKKKSRKGCSVKCPFVSEANLAQLSTRKGMIYQKREDLGEGHSYIAQMYKAYRNGAKKRGYEFELIRVDFANLIRQSCYYCLALPSLRSMKRKGRIHEANVNGLDRTDNSKGYTLENVVPCCATCNFLKGPLNREEFLKQIRLISANH